MSAKSFGFAMLGIIGCVLGALFGEGILYVILDEAEGSSGDSHPVDLMFVLDTSGSMDEEIEGVLNGIEEFADEFLDRDLDLQFGVTVFQECASEDPPEVLRFSGNDFTSNTRTFKRGISRLTAAGGCSDGESSYDATALAARQSFRSDATKVILLITDEPPRVPDSNIGSRSELERELQRYEIDQLHLVIMPEDRSSFSPLQNIAPGRIYSIEDTAQGRQDFAEVLPDIGSDIASDIGSSAISTGSDEDRATLVVTTSLWTAMLAMGVFLALSVGQRRYVETTFSSQRLGLSVAGSAAAGLLAGALGEVVYGLAEEAEVISRIGAWALLGALTGYGLSFLIPNLASVQATIGSGVGGGFGAIGFLVLSEIAGDIPARFGGAAILGGSIGLMVVAVETMFRQAWLQIITPDKTSEVNLGATPVTVGNNETCMVFLRDVEPLEFSFVNGDVICRDMRTGQVSTNVEQLARGRVQFVVQRRTGAAPPPTGAPVYGAQPGGTMAAQYDMSAAPVAQQQMAPIYLLIDNSALNTSLAFLNQSLPQLLQRLQYTPELRDRVALSVVSTDMQTVIPLTPVSQLQSWPALNPGYTQYLDNAFQNILQQVSQPQSVRPLVIVIAAALMPGPWQSSAAQFLQRVQSKNLNLIVLSPGNKIDANMVRSLTTVPLVFTRDMSAGSIQAMAQWLTEAIIVISQGMLRGDDQISLPALPAELQIQQ